MVVLDVVAVVVAVAAVVDAVVVVKKRRTNGTYFLRTLYTSNELLSKLTVLMSFQGSRH